MIPKNQIEYLMSKPGCPACGRSMSIDEGLGFGIVVCDQEKLKELNEKAREYRVNRYRKALEEGLEMYEKARPRTRYEIARGV